MTRYERIIRVIKHRRWFFVALGIVLVFYLLTLTLFHDWLSAYSGLGLVFLLTAVAVVSIPIVDSLRAIWEPTADSAPTTSPQHQLRTPPVDFTGRNKELADLRALACPGMHLLLHGAPGVGKSALAYALADSLKAQYPDAQLFFDLHAHAETEARLSTHDAQAHVLKSLAHSSQGAGVQLEGFYRDCLQNKRAILLFDDVGDATQVAELLPSVPHTCLVIFTTRLHIELTAMPLHGYEVPLLPPEHARAFLRQHAPRLTHLADKFVEICAGFPLALNLVARTIKENKDLQVEEYLGRLRSAPEQVMRAALNVSYDLLDGTTRDRWCVLAIMRGDFAANAAASCWDLPLTDKDSQSHEAYVTLNKLTCVHLVEWDTASQRYRLHALFREYALGKLTSAERTQTQRRYADHFATVLSAAKAELETNPSQARDWARREWTHIMVGLTWASAQTDRLCIRYALNIAPFVNAEAEIEALRTAQTCLTAPDDTPQLLKVRLALAEALRTAGHMESARTMDHETLALARTTQDTEAQASALSGLGDTLLMTADYAEAQGRYAEALELCRAIGDRRGAASALRGLGDALLMAANYPEAQGQYAEALELFRAIGDRQGAASALRGLGDALRMTANYAEAQGRDAEALELCRAIGDRQGAASALRGLGDALRMTDDYAEAQGRYAEALELFRAIGDRRGAAYALRGLGDALRMTDDYAEAQGRHAEVLELCRAIGDRQGAAYALRGLGEVLLMAANYPEAQGRYAEALELFRAIGDRRGAAYALLGLGEVLRMAANYPEAQGRYAEALELFRAIGDRRGAVYALRGLGDALRMTDDYPEAQGRYAEALELCRAIGERQSAASALLGLGHVLLMASNYPEAQGRYAEALELCRAIGDRQSAASALHGLGDVLQMTGHFHKAATHYEESYQLFWEIEDQLGQVQILLELGKVYLNLQGPRHQPLSTRTGYEEPSSFHVLAPVENSPWNQADTLRLSLLGQVPQFEYNEEYIRKALELAREIGVPSVEGSALFALSKVQAHYGTTAQAIESARAALAVRLRISDPAAQATQAWLTELEGKSAPAP